MTGAATAPGDVPDTGGDAATVAGGEDERESIVRAIGPKVRHLRRAAGLSLQQLARRAEVSAAAIHKVERGDMVPTVTTLLKLASALGRPMGHFVDGDGEPAPVAHLVRADERPTTLSQPGISQSVLTGPAARFALRATATALDPGNEFVPDRHGGEDLIVLLDGELHVAVADETYTLAQGDALHVPAEVRMRVHNAATAPARALWLSSRGS